MCYTRITFSAGVHPDLQAEADKLGMSISLFGGNIEDLLAKYQKKIVGKHLWFYIWVQMSIKMLLIKGMSATPANPHRKQQIVLCWIARDCGSTALASDNEWSWPQFSSTTTTVSGLKWNKRMDSRHEVYFFHLPCVSGTTCCFVFLDEQFLLWRVAEAAIDIYAMTAVISRASAALTSGLSSCEHEKLICQTFTEQVRLELPLSTLAFSLAGRLSPGLFSSSR